jgi:transposase
MARQKRSSYTSEKKQAVLVAVRARGVCAAAKEHGVLLSCVSRWAAAAGVTRAPTGAASSRAKTAKPLPEIKPRIAKAYTPTQKAQVLEHASAHGVTAASEKLGISRFSIYDWQRKLAKAAKGEGRSPTSGPAPQEVEAKRDREILDEWHKHPGLGPSQIVNQLRRSGVKVAVHTARRVMEGAGYRPPKVKREPHDQRYEAVRPNQMWHLDFVHRPPHVGHRNA